MLPGGAGGTLVHLAAEQVIQGGVQTIAIIQRIIQREVKVVEVTCNIKWLMC